jgi:hypothetical protein
MVSTNWTPIMSTHVRPSPSDESAGSGRHMVMTINAASMIINKPMGAHGRLGAMPQPCLGCVRALEDRGGLAELVP